ncbi:hypothetical protein VUJ49_24115 [Pseudomonas berkeleyensis]|uniref:Uncharacterized protein n=1 Tax=Pseudomonas berkeleyensis TaxID=2726956 RepID=A0A7G5DMS3_9PSED|nr:hypothetical protein [Pseudomonas berkeleyensis]QMV63048.1 hypothetical protein HS968_24015 [Pseudomonas berkeleyensis]WSO38503.1 hypothetical protein VUJ49_24115 [Pseudomonas berkeleyensis]
MDEAIKEGSFVSIPICTDPTKPKSELQLNLEKTQECATAIGNVCFAWATLESFQDRLIQSILGVKEQPLADTLLSNIDQREKVRIAIGLCYLKKLSDEWFAAIKWCLDQTDTDLRTRRNRIIHDKIHVSSQGVSRVQAKTGFRKPQAFQVEYYTEVIEPITPEEIWKLASDIREMIIRFDILWRAGYDHGKDWKKELEERSLMPKL